MTLKYIKPVRSAYYAKDLTSRESWYVETLKTYTFIDEDKEVIQPIVGKKKVCITAWCNVLGVSRGTLSKKRKGFRKGHVVPVTA